MQRRAFRSQICSLGYATSDLVDFAGHKESIAEQNRLTRAIAGNQIGFIASPLSRTAADTVVLNDTCSDLTTQQFVKLVHGGRLGG